jgi:hypothetical protein
MHRLTLYFALAAVLAAVSTAHASEARRARAGVELRDGVLTVSGKPFYPLGTWSDGAATPEELAQLGMNVDFRGIGPSAQGPANLQEHVNKFLRKGILVIPYFGFGGAGVIPWAKADLEAYLKPLGDSPGILAWYIGDDLSEVHLPGMRATADAVHGNDKMHPVVADYIAEPGPGGKAVFRPYLDIMCQYAYPIPNDSLAQYSRFFDVQRQSVGDPMWTWVQAFMWASTGSELLLGAEGPGPVPEPEQVRLLTYVALNRGVRGLLFFAIQQFRTIPETKAEIALLCREIKLLEPYLAGGQLTLDIPTSDPLVQASSFALPKGCVVPLVLMGENYYRWVDEAVREKVSFTIRGDGERPRALLVTLPEPVECQVLRSSQGRFRVIVPKLEMAGLVLVTSDAAELDRVKRQASRFAAEVAVLAVQGATAQLRKVEGAYWTMGGEAPGAGSSLAQAASRLQDAYAALGERQSAAALLRAREVMLLCRRAIDSTMRFAESRRSLVPQLEQRFLQSFYGLPHIPGILSAMPEDGGFRFLREFAIIGSFPLELKEETDAVIPAGFERPYPPETKIDLGATYDGMAGPVRWQFVRARLDADLNLLQYLAPSKNAVAYAAATIVAPRAMETTIGLGSNDGARVWLNGSLIFSKHMGRTASPNQNLIPVSLRAGANTVLVKIENWGARWDLYLSVRDPDKLLTFRLPE